MAGNEINLNESIQKIQKFFEEKKSSGAEKQKEIDDVDVKSIFEDAGVQNIATDDFGISFAEEYFQKEIDDTSAIDGKYLDAWKDVAGVDGDDSSISFEDVQEMLDQYRESNLPEGWDVDKGVIRTPDKKVVEARPSLEKDHEVKDGKIVDASGKEVGVVAQIEKDTNNDGKPDTVESYYYYTTDEKGTEPAEKTTEKGETPISKSELDEKGLKVDDEGNIVDKSGKIVGRTEVSYADGTGDGVTDKITSYFLFETGETDDKKLPEGWKQNEDGTITDDKGKTLGGTSVQADDLAALGYTIADDGYIYPPGVEPGDPSKAVGRNHTTEADVDKNGSLDTVQDCYLYASEGAKEPEGFPDNWTMNQDGTITDENGNLLDGTGDDASALTQKGYTIADDGYIYPPGIEAGDPANAVGRSYSIETKDADGNPVVATACYLDATHQATLPAEANVPPLEAANNLPDGLTQDENGKITDENGRELSVVESDDESLKDLTEKDGEYYNEYGQKVAITGEDGTVYMYNEVPELEKVPKSKDEAFPEGKNYEVDDSGNIVDKDTGFIVGTVEVTYADGTGDGVTDKITSYYLYEEVEPEPATKTPSEPAPAQEPPVNETPPAAEVPPAEETPPADDVPPAEDPGEEVPVLQTPPEDDEKQSVITDDAAAQFAKQLYDATAGRLGTDDQQFNDILANPDLTADDWVKIISSYNETYGSFIQDVDADFSAFSGKDDIMAGITSKLLEAAEGGSEEAIALLAKEFHNGTAGMAGTADEFIESFMNNASDEVLSAVMQAYSETNDGANIYDDIKKDFSGKIEDAYIARLNEILAKMREV